MSINTVFVKYVLPLTALGLVIFSVAHALHIQRPEPQSPPPLTPPKSPFEDTVAGAGIVEPSTEASGTGNIAVGSQVAGTVTNVAVHVGQEVKAGDLLFELDSRLAKADLKVREAVVAVSEAQVGVAGATLKTAKDQYERARMSRETAVIAEQEYVATEQTYLSAQAQLTQAKANVVQALAQVQQVQTQLQILKVLAPVDGTVIQVNVRPGEYVSTTAGHSLVLMGNLRPLHVRVNVDEEDLPRLKLSTAARAKVRGDASQTEISLIFVRLEPFVVPKTSLTGVNTERVDTRVAQIIFAVDPDTPLLKQKRVLVGQLLDVFIDGHPEK